MRHRGQKDLHCQLNWNSEGPGDQPQRQSWIFNQEQQLLQDNYHAGSKTWSTHVIFELFQIIYSILLVTTFLCLVSKITNICSWWQCNRLLYNLCSTVSMGKGKDLCTRTGNVEGEKKRENQSRLCMPQDYLMAAYYQQALLSRQQLPPFRNGFLQVRCCKTLSCSAGRHLFKTC